MATSATVSKGTIVKIKGASLPFTKISELKDFSGIGSGTAAIIDSTHTESTAKEKLVGVADEGSYKLTFNYNATDPGTLILQDRRATSTLANFQILLGTTGKTLNFDAFVMSAEISGGVDKVLELAVTIEISGAVTVT